MKKAYQFIVLCMAAALVLMPGGASGQEAVGLIVDQTGNVGVGTENPIYSHDVVKIGSHAISNVRTYSTDSTQSSRLYLMKSHSDSEVFATTVNGETLGRIHFDGVDSASGKRTGAIITAIQNGTAQADRVPTDIRFLTGSETDPMGTRMTINTDGNIGIDTFTQFGGGKGVLSIGNADVNPSSAPASAALFYASSGAMYVFDANGNETILSPHPSADIDTLADPGDPYPHFEKSTNAFIGKEIVIDKGKAFRLLQTLFPNERFIWYRNIPKTGITEERLNAWKKDWIMKHTEEVEITKDQAFASVNVAVEDRARVVGEKVSYALQGRDVVAVKKPVYAKRTEQRWELREGVTFDSETGRFFMEMVPTDAQAEAAAQQSPDLGLARWVRDRM